MNLYEVIRWGNDSSPFGPDGEDTCYLVRASRPEEAASLVDPLLAALPHERVAPFAHAVYHIGFDADSQAEAQVLRGPYIQHALQFGKWQIWHRDEPDGAWVEFEHRT